MEQPNNFERVVVGRRPVWWIVFRKEWVELLRDGRSLLFTLLLPVFVVPAAILLFGGFTTSSSDAQAILRARQAMAVFLPMFLTMFCFLGCMYPAIDLFAGEKERRTLETLWLTPAARSELAVGKIFLCATTGWISAALCLCVFYGGGGLIALFRVMGLPVAQSWATSVSTLTASSAFLIAVWLVLLAITFATTLLAISANASSFKEAQSMMTPLYVGLSLAMAPLFFARDFASQPGAWRWATVPLVNLMLLIQQQFRQQVSSSFASVTVGSSLLVAALMFAVCLRFSQREQSFH